MGVYELKTHSRGARPRSKRLRELGASGAAASGGGTIVHVYGGGSAVGNDHYHENKRTLDQITIDSDGYQYLTRLVESVDDDGNEIYTEVTEKIKAGYADKALEAYNLSADSPVRGLFLSRLTDDVAKGNITFEKMIQVLGAAIFNAGASFGTDGAGKIDAQGSAEFESVKVRSYFECLELIINRLSAIEGDQLLTEGDTVECVDDLGGGRYGLQLRKKWDGYYTAQAVNNVLKGVINTLNAGSGEYITSWLRVDSVDIANNYIEVTLYADTDTPAGKNYAPRELMTIARWGNQTDTTRQSSIYLSSTEGRIVRLTGVTKPIVDASNYGATFGTLPEFLREMDLPVASNQDYIYARGLIVQDIIRLDYQGKPVSEIVDRGAWAAGIYYYCEDLNTDTGSYETSDVWHYGCRYRCAKSGTKIEPGWGVTDWAMVEGNPDITASFVESGLVCNDPATFSGTLTLKVMAHNRDITRTFNRSDIVWERTTVVDATLQTRADNEWNTLHRGVGSSIQLTSADIYTSDWGPTTLTRYTATLTKYKISVSMEVVFGGVDGATGARGERGPTLRGPQEWQNLPDGYHFYSGASGEPYIDIVLHNGYYYSCVAAHDKMRATAPGDSNSWQLGDSVELVATKLLLAEYALIENLGVGAIEMKDKSTGLPVFIAKDGNLQCSTGTFENVNIKNGVFGGWNFSETGMSNVKDAWYDHDVGILCAYTFYNSLAAIGSGVHSEEDGHRLLARFEHLRWPAGGLERNDKYNVKISTQGSAARNIAIDIQGGCIQGLAMSNKVVTLSDFNSNSSTYEIKSYENNILYTATKAGKVVLPAMQPHDDGHVVRIKNLSNYTLSVQANKCTTSYNGTAAYPGFMINRGENATIVEIAAICDSMEFVWVRDLTSTYQGGTWVQYKIPRDW